eukprot:6189642-Pleurochrysis_carterae.AAC.1
MTEETSLHAAECGSHASGVPVSASVQRALQRDLAVRADCEGVVQRCVCHKCTAGSERVREHEASKGGRRLYGQADRMPHIYRSTHNHMHVIACVSHACSRIGSPLHTENIDGEHLNNMPRAPSRREARLTFL